MRISMDAAGRLVIPKRLRELAGLLHPGEVEIEWVEGKLVIQPPPLEVRLVQRGAFVVAEPVSEGIPPLEGDQVESTRDAVHRDRARRSVQE